MPGLAPIPSRHRTADQKPGLGRAAYGRGRTRDSGCAQAAAAGSCAGPRRDLIRGQVERTSLRARLVPPLTCHGPGLELRLASRASRPPQQELVYLFLTSSGQSRRGMWESPLACPSPVLGPCQTRTRQVERGTGPWRPRGEARQDGGQKCRAISSSPKTLFGVLSRLPLRPPAQTKSPGVVLGWHLRRHYSSAEAMLGK